MNPRNRLLEAVRSGRPDRVPLNLERFHYATREAIDALPDPGVAEIAHRIFDDTHCFVSFPSCINRYLVTPQQNIRRVNQEQKNGTVTNTSVIDTPKGQLTAVTSSNPTTQCSWTEKYPVESLEDIEKIRSIPWERPPGLSVPDLSQLTDDFDERGITRTSLSSPFVCVAGMMPYQYFLELCATEFELLKELTAICTERILDILDVLLSEKNIEWVWMGGCEWLTPPMGSPKHYEELVHQFEKPVIDRIHEAGGISHVHCHGNVRSTIEMVIERGGDYFQPMEPPPDGDMTMYEAKAQVNGRMALGGNLEARVLEGDDIHAVEEATRAAFEGGNDFLIIENSAGPLSRMTPQTIANHHRMLDLWEDLSLS